MGTAKPNFSELISGIKRIPFYEHRGDAENFLEFVCRPGDLDKVTGVLEGYFGASAKPAGTEPSEIHRKVMEPFGGIQKNQTLYCRIQDETVECAMLWPWQTQGLVTVKVVQFTSTVGKKSNSPFKNLFRSILGH